MHGSQRHQSLQLNKDKMKFSHLAVVLTSLAISMDMAPIPTAFQEDFAGAHALSKAVFEAGYACMARDIKMSRKLDITSTVGFMAILQGLRCLAIGALAWLAVPCSSWIFLSRGSSKRTRLRPKGKRTFKKVSLANKVARRVVYLCHYIEKKGAFWCIENPTSSIINQYPPMRELLDRPEIREIRVNLGQFGASSMIHVCTFNMSNEVCIYNYIYIFR